MILISQAQIEKGRYLIGGSGDISEAFSGTSSTFNMTLAPSFGVFVIRGFAVGGRYSVGISSQRTYDAVHQLYNTTTTFTTAVGPNLKYYLGKKSLKGFSGFSAAYQVSTSIHKTSISNLDGFSLNGSLGMAYFFNAHISLEAALYINASGYQTQFPTTRTGISLGLYAFLDKKKQE